MNWLIARAGFKKLWGIKWSTGYNVESHLLDLESFTFEIADKPAEHRTIDKRVKASILNRINVLECRINEQEPGSVLHTLNGLFDYLNSLEET